MPKVRRNDPCPCGSGKKYKNCCLRQERLVESRELSLSNTEATLLNALYEYAQSERFASDTLDAFHFFWGGRYDPRGIAQLDYEDRLRTVEWFLHDYKTKAEGRYIIDLYIEREAVDFPPEALHILEAWSCSVMGMFRVLSIGPGIALQVYDSLQKRELVVEDVVAARNAQQGDLLIGRLYELDGVKRLSLMTMILPAEYEPGLVAYVTNAYRVYREQHPAATWDIFMRENGHLFQAYLLSPKAEALRSLIGPGTRYHDPVVGRDKLAEFTRQQRRAEEEAAARPEEPVFHRTATGIILPGVEPQEEEVAPKEEPADRPHILIPGRDF